jgi:hypothetical protein
MTNSIQGLYYLRVLYKSHICKGGRFSGTASIIQYLIFGFNQILFIAYISEFHELGPVSISTVRPHLSLHSIFLNSSSERNPSLIFYVRRASIIYVKINSLQRVGSCR